MRRLKKTWANAALVACVLAVATACAGARPVGRSRDDGVVTSNILRRDYAGSSACRPCHPAIYDAFMASPMHRMTRHADPGEVHAPFDGTAFHFKDDTVTMEEHDGRKYVRVERPGSATRLYRVTKVIGGHYREDFVGERVTGTEDGAKVVQEPGGERVMPVSWLLFAPAWRYKGYSVMVREREHVASGMPWRETCLFCHNTVPRLTSLYDDLRPSSETYQGSVSERYLPASRLLRYEPADSDALARAVSDEVALLGGPRVKGSLAAVLETAARETRRRFGESNLLELGIGCEACHNGSKEHVADPTRHPSFELQTDLIDVVTPDGKTPTRAAFINRTCVRCHTVLFSEYPYTWEGGERRRSPGGTHINSGEARDFILGSCADRMACTACHDPHSGSRRERLDWLGTVAANSVCTSCHQQFAGGDALTRHTHHSENGEGSACLSCHMPRKNMGLEYRLTRYHRIGSPADPERVERDRPLECALCHADRSVASLVGTMEKWWGRSYDREKLRSLYGRLEANTLAATIAYGKPHEVATAAATLGERGGRGAAATIAPALTNPYPLVRYFARRALAQASGRPVPIDVEQDPGAIREALAKWLDQGKP
ncbi:MAG TPA: cytochrome c3 family protein [Polyangiaceae bacterium]|nr:cytochrome c3 family protein [Polyangiaceae bacterium]